MARHPFQPGETYLLAQVLEACEQYLASGAVAAAEEKRQLVELMRSTGPVLMVWSPSGPGWGESPFNPGSWRAPDGKPLLPAWVAVPQLPE
jgi:hypothetical protein